MYIKGYVKTVHTKRSKQCYCVLSRVSCLLTLSTQRSKQAMYLMLYLSTLSTLMFVALTQHLMQVRKVASRPCQEGRLLYCDHAFHLGGLAVHQSVWGGSFVNFLGLVKLQGWLQARCTDNPQFLNVMWALSNPVILTYLWEQSCILHTLTEPATINLEFRALEYLKCGSLWSSFGIDRFRCLHSSLMRAIRCANSEHSASNSGLPTDPHSPESNSLYLAQIWSIRELYSLCASCTVSE